MSAIRLRTAAAALLACAWGVAYADPAGVVKVVDGDARAASGGKERSLKVGDVVNEGETLVTGKDSELHLGMQDSGFMVLRPNTRFQIEKYKADGDDGDSSVFRLLSGGVRSITGWIGKFNPRSYQIRTQQATIGVRGTDHETRYVPEGSAEGEPGTYDRVYEGETVIETADGRETVGKDQAGFHSARAPARPRRLGAIPVFYRPGRHEAQVARMHAEIQRIVAERRAERQKLMQERRSNVQDLRSKQKEMQEQGKHLSAPQRADMAEKREALKRDARAARELHEEIQRDRKALEADVKSGRAGRPEARERRAAILEKEKTLTRTQENINARLKEMNETLDSVLR